jgi:hypothetical protein
MCFKPAAKLNINLILPGKKSRDKMWRPAGPKKSCSGKQVDAGAA